MGEAMRANATFSRMGKDFWAHVRSLSQAIGYTDRATGGIKVPKFGQILDAMAKLGLSCDHLLENNKPSDYGIRLLNYFAYRAEVLNNTVQHQLMDAARA